MKKIIADSTALILLAKCSLLQTLCTRFEVVVPSSVIDETASDELVKDYPDASLIRDLFNKGFFKIELPESGKLNTPITLHRGESDALMLTLQSPDTLYATDDVKAIKAARFMKIPFIITPKIVVDLYRLREISFDKARHSIEKLGKIGRYSPEILAESILSLKEVRNGKTHDNTHT